MSDFARDRWAQVQQYQVDIGVFGANMRDAASTQISRDIATRKFVCSVDCLIAELDALAIDGALAEIAEFLEARGRRLS